MYERFDQNGAKKNSRNESEIQQILSADYIFIFSFCFVLFI